eukprot:5057368-Prymnesium_polylepis.1
MARFLRVSTQFPRAPPTKDTPPESAAPSSYVKPTPAREQRAQKPKQPRSSLYGSLLASSSLR